MTYDDEDDVFEYLFISFIIFCGFILWEFLPCNDILA